MEQGIFSRNFWHTPAVRHLAWLTHSVSLAQEQEAASLFEPPQPEQLLSELKALDAQPQPLLDRLARRTNRRLGVYFEDLYRFALENLWQREVMMQNQAVRADGRTLGELDFVVRDRLSGHYEHHEIAVKFYLGCYPSGRDADWLGPDRRDRLQDKLEKLAGSQSSLTRHPQTQALLHARAIESVVDLVFLRGYLFYPADQRAPTLPAGIARDHARGRWLTLSRARQQGWHPQHPRIQLRKPDWLGPMQLQEQSLPLSEPHYLESLALIAERGFPLLFAQLEWQEAGFWLETQRFFVVPDGWPDLAGNID